MAGLGVDTIDIVKFHSRPKVIAQYSEMLQKMAEKQYINTSGWPVELQLASAILLNTVFFAMKKFFPDSPLIDVVSGGIIGEAAVEAARETQPTVAPQPVAPPTTHFRPMTFEATKPRASLAPPPTSLYTPPPPRQPPPPPPTMPQPLKEQPVAPFQPMIPSTVTSSVPSATPSNNQPTTNQPSLL